MERDIVYENDNITTESLRGCWSDYDGRSIKCKNHRVCGTVLPLWHFQYYKNYLCSDCDRLFGKELEFGTLAECQFCLGENKESVKQPRCSHSLCTDCFRRCYFDEYNREGEPEFPYPEIEDDYYDDQDNQKWATEYPLIRVFNEQWEKWDRELENKYRREEYLRRCTLCRL
jgi:hypothetical protein